MRERLLFIYNPNAGKAKLKAKLSDIVVEFSENGYEVIVMPTTKHGDATEFAKEYAQHGACSRIVCAGGDGTLNEVVTGVMQSGVRVPIGYIPAGTTNDFGYSLKIPKDAIEAAKFAALEEPMPSDVGEICGNTFVYTAAFGLFSDVSYDTSQDMKNILGRVAYLLRGVRSVVEVQNYELRVEYLEAEEDVQEMAESAREATAVGEEAADIENATKDFGKAANAWEAADAGDKTTSAGKATAVQGAADIKNETKDFKKAANAWEAADAEGETTSGDKATEVPGAADIENAAKDFGKAAGTQEAVDMRNRTGNERKMEGMPETKTEPPFNETLQKTAPSTGNWRQVEGEFICGMVANSNSVGGFKGIMGKGVRFDDGVFEMLLIRKPRNVIELTEIVNELISKKLRSDNIVYAHVREVKVAADGELPWSLDGEFGGDMPQAQIHIRQQAVDYIRKEVE